MGAYYTLYYDAIDIEEGIAIDVEDDLQSRSTAAEKVFVCMYVCMKYTSFPPVYLVLKTMYVTFVQFYLRSLAASRPWRNRSLSSPTRSSLPLIAKRYSTILLLLILF